MLLALSLLLVGCGGNEEVTYTRDIAPIMMDSCVNCHQDGGIGPFPLTTYDEVEIVGALVAGAVADRTMPPFLADGSGECHDWQDSPALTDEQIGLVADWVNLGMPEGRKSDLPEAPAAPTPLETDFTLSLPEPYTIDNSKTDDYRCFIMELPWEGQQYLTGYEIIPDASAAVHHVILYRVTSPIGLVLAVDLDVADEGPGYNCYGSTGTIAEPIAAWAPGTGATEFPENTGIPLNGSSYLVVQMHYYPQGEVAVDQTSFGLRLEPQVEYPADIRLYADSELALNPGEEAGAYAYDRDADGDITVHAMYPHMHGKGASIRLDGLSETESSCMVDVPRWDFGWQQFFFPEQPIAVSEDHVLRTSCTYDTTGSTEFVTWGDGTDDEMCVMALYVTEGTYPGAVELESLVTPTERPGAATLDALTPAWSATMGADWYNRPRAIAEYDGDLYISGFVRGDDASFGTQSPNIENNGDAFVARVGSAGDVVWAVTFGGVGSDSVNALHVDDSGVYVGGMVRGNSLSVGGTSLDGLGGKDLFVGRLDHDGTWDWANRYGSDKDDEIEAVVRDAAGTLWLTGWIGGVATVGDDQVGGSGTNVVLLRIESDGTGAEAAASTNGSGWGAGLALDGAGGVYLSGGAVDGTELLGATLSAVGGEDAFVARIDDVWDATWVQTWGGLGDDVARAVAVDASGPIAGGWVRGDVTLGADVLAYDSGQDAAFAAFDSDGALRWSQGLHGIGVEEVRSVAIDDSGKVVTAVSFTGELTADGVQLDAVGNADVAVFRIDGDSVDLLGRFGGLRAEDDALVHASADDLVVAWRSDFGRIGEQAMGASSVLTRFSVSR